MTINIADNSPRISYTVAEGATQTSFAVPFEFFDNGDLNVYVDGTLKTITTHYTVSGGDGSTGTVTISVTGATGGSTVVITRDIALERTTDFPVSGAFNIVALNTELDRLVAVAADLEDQSNRALQLTDFDAAVSLVLPDVDTRKGKTLAFNASTGAVEAGPSISDTQTVSAASADIATLADTQDGTTGTNSITTLASNVANVTTVAGISANVTTVAGIASNISTVAADGTDIGTVATNIASVNTVATNIADVITVANDLAEAVSEVETVANDLNEAVSEIDTVAGSISNVDAVGGSITNVNTVATGIANINTVAGISSNVTTVAGDTTHIQALGPISSDITTVSGISSNVSTVAGISSSVPTVASVSANVSTVAGISANVTTVAGISANVTTVASNVSSIQNFADVYRIGSSDPTSSLDTGDLFYNTSSSQMKVYNGSAWEAGVLSGSGTLLTANNLSDLNSASTAITNLGITASAAELNFVDGVTSNIQTQIDAISPDPTLGTLTKSFANGESSVITLSSTVSPTAIVAVTKEVSQTGVSSKGGWDVASDAANYDLYNQAPSTSLTLQGWDISTSSFVQSFSVVTQEGSPHGVQFKSDGTKMFIIGSDGDDINEYNLSTAWNISTATYSQNFSIASQDTHPSDLFFKSDGTKVYVVGDAGNAIDEWDLSTAWDVSTLSFNQSFSVNSQDIYPQSLFFKPDGLRMYLSGQGNDKVYEYTLTTAWDVSTASFSQDFSVASEETNPRGLFFKSDGTKMYVTGNNGQDVNEYNLSTAWDISTASAYQVFDVSSKATYPTGIYFRDDGLKMYIVGLNNDQVHEYDVSGPFALGTGSFASSDVGKRIFTSDGGEAILTATDGSYSLSSAFGATTYTSGNWSLSGLDVDTTNGITLSGAMIGTWDISTASYDSVSFSVASEDISPRVIFFKPDGTKMYLVGIVGKDINEYNLSTAWDISTTSYNQNFSVASQETSPTGVFFRDDGLKMYVCGGAGDDVNEYDLSTAWDVSTASYLQNFSVASQENAPQSLFFKSDGTKMYVMGSTGDDINEYHLTTAWDISTASYDSVFDISAQDTIPTDFYFRSDGLKMYHNGVSNDKIFEYNLGTAWDVSTAVYLQSFSAPDAADCYGMFIKPDGTRMFLCSLTSDAVHQYSIGSNKQPTAQYLPALTSTGGQIDSTYWTDINSMTADDVDNDGQVYYAVSTDGRTIWSIAKASDGVRPIVRNNGGTWQYNSNATYGSTTYTNGTTNDEFATIAQAMTVAANQMDKAQIDAVTDGSHFTLGNTLDLAIIPYLASTGTAPTSDGVSINYDAAALNKGAILGTDYDYDVPATNKVRITSNAAQNLKVRIV